jgi:calcineurin-like phosphoesterase family protein
MIWFTADTHFGHANIIKHCKRPFFSVEEMDAELARRWNECVGTDDEVYVLGDFCWRSHNHAIPILEQLHGTKYLVEGNHDRACTGNKRFVSMWKWIKPLAEIKVPNGDDATRIVLCHFALRVWHQSHRGSWHLYGHSHGSLPDDPTARSIDVGVDARRYAPISFESIKSIMATKQWQPVDHHRGDHYA